MIKKRVVEGYGILRWMNKNSDKKRRRIVYKNILIPRIHLKNLRIHEENETREEEE